MEDWVMTLGRLWAGKVFGTNTGNLFVSLEGKNDDLKGILRFNETGSGLVIYSISGSFDGTRLTLMGEPQTHVEGMTFGQLTANATLNQQGELEGEWETSIGSAGTFFLFPHNRRQAPSLPRQADQLHTARHRFGAIAIDREQIISLAEDIQREFEKGTVIITVTTGTEQSRFLEDFKNFNFNIDRAEFIKLFVNEPESDGTNKVVSVEFGPHYNEVMTQGSNEAWVLGKLEKLKRDLNRFERAYATNFKRFGFGINQLLLIATVVFLPSLETILDRAILMTGVLFLIISVNWLHKKYLPLAVIYLGNKSDGMLARFTPSVFSWLIAIVASATASLLAAYLQGWMALLLSS